MKLETPSAIPQREYLRLSIDPVLISDLCSESAKLNFRTAPATRA